MLFSPFEFTHAKKSMHNRIALAPLTNLQSHDDGTLSDDEYHWLVRRAKEGFGMIITCAVNVSVDGKGWAGELGAFSDAHMPGLKKLADGIRENDSLSIVQLFHGGARSPQTVIHTQPWSASEHTMQFGDKEIAIREATTQDIERVVNDFTDAAVRVFNAGFDGIELHGAHGYLIHQFLSSETNKRTDKWGGSFEKRIAFLRTIIQSVQRKVSRNFIIGVRISPEDKYTFKGIDFDESLQLAKILAEDGIDYLHVSSWEALKRPDKHAQIDKTIIEYFREAVPGLPLMVAGGIWDRKDAEQALSLGADFVAIGKAAIGHANWPSLIKDSNAQPLQPPYTVEHLQKQDLGPAFIDYMKRWKGFVNG